MSTAVCGVGDFGFRRAGNSNASAKKPFCESDEEVTMPAGRSAGFDIGYCERHGNADPRNKQIGSASGDRGGCTGDPEILQ